MPFPRRCFYVFILGITLLQPSSALPKSHAQGGLEAFVSWSPDGKSVLANLINEESHFYFVILDVATQEVRELMPEELASEALYISSVAWSPDGSQIAFDSYHPSENPSSIYVVDAAGGNLINLTHQLEGDLEISNWAWSPDGSQIVFVGKLLSANRSDIYVVDRDGANVINLTSQLKDNFGIIDLPISNWAWSPDGSQIAFTLVYENASDKYVTDIYVVDADGGSLINLTDQLESYTEPWNWAWSPDGSQIAFVGNQRNAEDNTQAVVDIFLVDGDGDNLINLTTELSAGADAPVWSPDGSQITFVGRQSTYDENILDVNELYLVDADGGNLTKLTSAPKTNVESLYLPVWSADSKRIAFISDEDLYVVDTVGSLPLSVTKDAGFVTTFSWSPEASQLAFDSLSFEGNSLLYVVDADGSHPRKIAEFGDYYSFAWSPDGQGIAVNHAFEEVLIYPIDR